MSLRWLQFDPLSLLLDLLLRHQHFVSFGLFLTVIKKQHSKPALFFICLFSRSVSKSQGHIFRLEVLIQEL